MPEAESTRAIKVFYCYARKDKVLRDELDKHLGALKRSGQITTWYDREIQPGNEWAEEIDTRLNTADIVLLLVSPDFIHSDYCYGKEMSRALERREARETYVIPIILRPVDWEGTPIAELQALPTDGKPITKWLHRDDAFRNVAGEVRKVVTTLQKTVDQWKDEGLIQYNAKQYDMALDAYEHAIRLRPDRATLHLLKGIILTDLNRHDEALAAYERAIHLEPDNPHLYANKGNALRELSRHNEALGAYELAIRLNPDEASYHRELSEVLFELRRHKEALAAAEEAIRLNPNDSLAYKSKGWALRLLKRHRESFEVFQKSEELEKKRDSLSLTDD